MFDITKFRSADTFEIALKDPEGNILKNDQKQICAVEMYAKGSSNFTDASEKFSKRLAKLRTKHKDFDNIPRDEIMRVKCDFLCECTVGFKNFSYAELSGADAVKAFYLDSRLGFMHDQIDADLGKWKMPD